MSFSRLKQIGLFGENSLEGAHLVKAKDTDREEYMDIAIDGFFLAIGHKTKYRHISSGTSRR